MCVCVSYVFNNLCVRHHAQERVVCDQVFSDACVGPVLDPGLAVCCVCVLTILVETSVRHCACLCVCLRHSVSGSFFVEVIMCLMICVRGTVFV